MARALARAPGGQEGMSPECRTDHVLVCVFRGSGVLPHGLSLSDSLALGTVTIRYRRWTGRH